MAMTTLRPLSGEAFPAFFEAAVEVYAAENIAAGRWPATHAPALSRADNAKLLPQGVETTGQFLFEIVNEDCPVGYLWLSAMTRGLAKIAFVCQVVIKPEHRRQGHAQAALGAAEDFAMAQGRCGIALHVFAHNEAAQALY